MSMNRQGLLDLKKEIENAQTKLSTIEGQKSMLMKQLSKDLGCDSVKEAEKLLGTTKKEADRLNEEINNGLNELENEYPTTST